MKPVDRRLERKFSERQKEKKSVNLINLTLILTPGDATPTYDEPDSEKSGIFGNDSFSKKSV